MGDPTVPDPDVGVSAEPDLDPDPVLRRVSDLVADRNRARTARPVVVGIGGPVCVGKSTYSAALAERLRGQGGLVTVVVAGDGFLWPNAVLAERGILERKGFPESYDLLGASGFLDAERSGDRDVVAPRYSHEDYDVVEGSEPVGAVDVVIFEGVVVLQETFGPRLDLEPTDHPAKRHLIRDIPPIRQDRDRFLCSREGGKDFFFLLGVDDLATPDLCAPCGLFNVGHLRKIFALDVVAVRERLVGGHQRIERAAARRELRGRAGIPAVPGVLVSPSFQSHRPESLDS